MISVEDLLEREFQIRNQSNHRYSMRAFARDLNVNITSLSLALSKKRRLSKYNIRKISQALGLSSIEQSFYLNHNSKSGSYPVENSDQMDIESFRLIADWYFLAILNLATLKDAPRTANGYAQRLNLSRDEIQKAVELLQQMGLIRLDAKGRIIRTCKEIKTGDQIPSSAIRNHHRQKCTLASEALLRTPMEIRYFSSATFTFSESSLKKAERILKQTQKELLKLSNNMQDDEVYTLNLQLFPLTKKSKKGKK